MVALSPNHWTARKFPEPKFFFFNLIPILPQGPWANHADFSLFKCMSSLKFSSLNVNLR